MTTMMTTAFLDSDIERKVLRLLRWDPRVDTSGVCVEVEDGTVRLSGTVPDREANLATVMIAASVSGVRGVENGLRQRRRPAAKASPPGT